MERKTGMMKVVTSCSKPCLFCSGFVVHSMCEYKGRDSDCNTATNILWFDDPKILVQNCLHVSM